MGIQDSKDQKLINAGFMQALHAARSRLGQESDLPVSTDASLLKANVSSVMLGSVDKSKVQNGGSPLKFEQRPKEIQDNSVMRNQSLAATRGNVEPLELSSSEPSLRLNQSFDSDFSLPNHQQVEQQLRRQQQQLEQQRLQHIRRQQQLEQSFRRQQQQLEQNFRRQQKQLEQQRQQQLRRQQQLEQQLRRQKQAEQQRQQQLRRQKQAEQQRQQQLRRQQQLEQQLHRQKQAEQQRQQHMTSLKSAPLDQRRPLSGGLDLLGDIENFAKSSSAFSKSQPAERGQPTREASFIGGRSPGFSGYESDRKEANMLEIEKAPLSLPVGEVQKDSIDRRHLSLLGEAREEQADSAGSSMLRRFKEEAQLKQQNSSMQEQSALDKKQEQNVRVLNFFNFFYDLSEQLNILQPAVKLKYSLPGAMSFNYLKWERSSVDLKKSPGYTDEESVAEEILIHVTFVSTDGNTIIEKNATSSRAFSQVIRSIGVNFTTEEVLNSKNQIEKTVFDVSPELSARVTASPDYDKGLLSLKTRNIGGMFGAGQYEIPIHELEPPVFESLAKLIMGDSMNFEKKYRRSGPVYGI